MENGVMFMVRRPGIIPFAAIFLGLGILLTCFLPSPVLVVLVAIAIIVVGFWCLKC